ncbi:hypothetical protein PLESTB_001193100 [Pleodorina starrii]|uniref:DNA-directed RNA polymerase subunit n=1 Tax=Pleodorina starrii TaxID=330485 RepID=A0A9W6BSA5_9CHLO|nr:hypothetical protein PLESTM_001830400 [Pleodorina starrii]GLC57153.1 hypothetical protein PLESTB_001193100 [Pleodorina starrii]GLC71464.1 hypothetical protein PLESTF_001118700 [Pleodorina starrii]
MSSDKDWMFCPKSGYLLNLDPKRQVAACNVSGYERSLAELSSVKVVLRTDMEDYRRRYALEPLVRSVEDEELLKGRKRATVDEPCPKCHHRQLEYYTMQLRSADEGQTVFYECRKCGYKYSQNT